MLPEKYDFNDVRYTPALVEYFIQRYTLPGDTVLDPFCGFGTTITVAKKLDRHGFGIEIDDTKVAFMREQYGFESELIHGDVKRLYLEQRLPAIDLIMTSPPYMGQEDTADALSGYRFAGSYENYLQEITHIFERLGNLLTDTGHIIVEIANLKQQNSITTLAWDVATHLSSILTFQGEVVITWTGERKSTGIYNYGYDHSYCLVFTN